MQRCLLHTFWGSNNVGLTRNFKALFSSNKRPALVGLDIGFSSVKLVELSLTADNSIQLERYACEPLPQHAIVDGNIENLSQVTDAVRRLWKKSGTRAKYAAIGLPFTSAITRTVVLPANIGEEQFAFMVESEASQYLPFPMEEVSVDFCTLGPVAGSYSHVEVLLAAARKDKIDDRVAIAEAIGITPLIVDIETYAARAAINRVLPQTTSITALFEIGSQSTHLSVSQGHELIYEREHPFGGQQLTDNIVAEFNLSFEEAEIRKKSGGLPAEYKNAVLTPYIDMLSFEIDRALQLFYTTTTYKSIDQILVSGGTALTRGLTDLLREQLQTQVAIVNPFEGMHLSKRVRETAVQKESAQYLVACGLALRKFD
jgi:type IV pilus assembly protein PilM